MNRRYTYLLLFLLGISQILMASKDPTEKKRLPAHRLQIEGPKIDGLLDEEIWKQAPKGDGFIEREPVPGDAPLFPSEVKVLYDDEALYIGAMLYDTAPDSILQQLTQRDEFGNADFFGVSLDCYKDGINGLEFAVTASGVQIDTKFGQNTNDRNWNAVWYSQVSLTEEGWVVEMKIPYAALRFPEVPIQEWHINFFRNIRRTREMSFWSPVDPALDGYFNQCGLLTDIKDIRPPVRLFLFPYVSAYVENDQSVGPKWENAFNGGMDLKYGINDAFTLDMTLIPDFGQVQSDNQVLNLSPFEVFFNEQRQFFTEGTELFTKADLFYSRRIGGRPLHHWAIYDEIDEDVEEVIENPRESRLINAAKVSGRNSNGLGIGVFNAVTAETRATIRDLETNETRTVITDPLTNYNILVLDQNLWSNSYVSLVNTNVYREGHDYEANVTGTEFRLSSKGNIWNVNGSAALSQLYYPDSTDLGHTFALRFEKTSGKFNYGVGNNFESNTYDPNDLGILFSNNESSFYGYFRHNVFEPFWKLNRMNNYFEINYQRLHIPDAFANFSMYMDHFISTKGFHAAGLWMASEPIETYDFFEPRVAGRWLNYPINHNVGWWVSSDYRKVFALDARMNYRWFQDGGRDRFNWGLSPRVRFSDKLLQVVSFDWYNFDQDVGWVNEVDEGIIIGRRDQDIFETVLETNYVFNPLMSLRFRLRHYWTRVKYLDYYALQDDGSLDGASYDGIDEETGISDHDTNFNAFNIDLVYRWVFTPGSEMSVVWKNSILGSNDVLYYDFSENLRNTFEMDQINSFSIKVLYFLDYRSLKSKKA
jgi:hypothetical protein